MVKLRVTGTPEEVRTFEKVLETSKMFYIKRKSKEYKRKYRYNDEISIYFDIIIAM